MPIFFQHQINETTRLGIWKIEENEDFFLGNVPLQKEVTHPHKRLQHLAGRFLLQFLFAGFPYELIRIADTNRPYLPNEQYHFSISHGGDYAAAIVSSTQRVGIDIEFPMERIRLIAKKFLSQFEHRYLANENRPLVQRTVSTQDAETIFLTFLWCAKESIFKWYGLGRVNFSNHISLRDDIAMRQDDLLEMPFVFDKEKPIGLTVYGHILPPLVLTWVMS
ncbi:MAG TPA: 4'-phosphopantetheinyl transferase superfamily protein [Chitinophagaceae bacterium]